jgi:hypothetical protein
MQMLQRRPPSDRERERRRDATRRCRERVRKGRGISLMEYDCRLLTLLARNDYLAEADMRDRGKVRKAIERFVQKAIDAEIL